jgi:hypothetical protein
MATEGSRVVIGGYCKECLRRREADIVSSMSIGPVGVRVSKATAARRVAVSAAERMQIAA